MKQLFNYPSAKLWCLMGLTGIVLSTAILLDEGQARTLSTLTLKTTRNINQQIFHHKPIITQDNPQHSVLQPPKVRPNGNFGVPKDSLKNKPTKKHAGMAILFLGLLAEQS